MAKIIDSFLFFQELDLLEIRLEYLYEKVDKFIIVEACQTFTGKPKLFNFEANISRFEKYIDKIIYYKIEDSHDSFDSVIGYLGSQHSKEYKKVLEIMNSHKHYPKDVLHWVLDTYHREALHLVYAKYLEDDDIVFLSDLDEIVSIEIFDNTELLISDRPTVCQQHEFMYFLNYYNNSDWLGTIFSKYENIKNKSLNGLRIDSKKIRSYVNQVEYKSGGYHFTTIGNIDTIKQKIQSWAHQEFNTKEIADRLEYNINTGQDIFEREYGTKMKKVAFSDRSIFDEKMSQIIASYPNLITEGEIMYVSKNYFYDHYRKYKSKFSRLFNRVMGLK